MNDTLTRGISLLKHRGLWLRERLFPMGCALCGRMLLDMEEAKYGLCRDCLSGLGLEREERCSLCGRPLISELDRCLQCRAEGHCFDQALPLFPYSGAYRELLVSYKFGGRRALGRFFADRLLEGLSLAADSFPGFPVEPVLVPVPPRPGKLKRGGWDQVEYMARLLDMARPLEQKVSICRCLERLPSQTQKELDKAGRKANLMGRIRCTSTALRGKIPREVVLFDDVITTGATLDACASALREGGAQKVYALCLCYT
jgi:ComF family protein